MKFLSLEPFVPSGNNFEKAKQFFIELGFAINWEVPGYIGFERDDCKFILQQFDNKSFAENFMLSVRIENAEAFRNEIIEKNLTGKYNIRIGQVTQQPYGKEVNIIDMAGVCWHFIE